MYYYLKRGFKLHRRISMMICGVLNQATGFHTEPGFVVTTVINGFRLHAFKTFNK